MDALKRYVEEGGELFSALQGVFACQSVQPVELYRVLGKCVVVWFARHEGEVQVAHKEERSSVFQVMKRLYSTVSGKGLGDGYRQKQLLIKQGFEPAALLNVYTTEMTSLLKRVVKDDRTPWSVVTEMLDQLLPSLESETLYEELARRIESLSPEELLLPETLSVLFQFYYTRSRFASTGLDALISAIKYYLAIPEMKAKAVQLAIPLILDCTRAGTSSLRALPVSDLLAACGSLEDALKLSLLEAVMEGPVYTELRSELRVWLRPLLSATVLRQVVSMSKWKWVERLLSLGYRLSSFPAEETVQSVFALALQNGVALHILSFFDLFAPGTQGSFQRYIECSPVSSQLQALQFVCLKSRNWACASLCLQFVVLSKDPILWGVCQRRLCILALVRRQGAIGRLPKALLRSLITEYL